MAFTEFFCRSGGSNLNGGGLSTGAEPNTTPVYSGVGDSDGTSVFTPSDGSTPASTVTVGDFASVYVTAGATVAVFIGRVTTVAAGVNGAITCSTTAKSGTFPAASAGAHTITCNVGGAWKGPNAASGFPFGFIAAATTNSTGEPPRVNFKNDANYNVTAQITSGVAGPVIFQGYTSSANDGGKAVIDGGTSGTSFAILRAQANNQYYTDLIFQNNGSTGSADAVILDNNGMVFYRCVVNNVVGHGFRTNGSGNSIMIECEAYACNGNNGAGNAGFIALTGSGNWINCISHDNAGSNSRGFRSAAGISLIMLNCIADTNGSHGFDISNASGNPQMIGCESYNNGGAGLSIGDNVSFLFIKNCNFIKNTGWGIDASTGTSIRSGYVYNCGFGAGTQANGSGTITVASKSNLVQSGNVTYASGVTPWVDPANGDFRINLAAAKNAGRGTFTQTAASYAGTVGYPDIGAAQHLDAGGILINPGMSGGLR